MKRVLSMNAIGWLVAGFGLVLGGAAWKVAQASTPLPPPFNQVVSQIVNTLKPRQYYLTKEEVTGGNALTACAAGYHMASLWEIFDTSNLRYNTDLGFTREDSGSGPPAGLHGWIRTGSASTTSSTPGIGNCAAWTTSENVPGTLAALSSDWTVASDSPTNPWGSAAGSCLGTFPVWCVAD